jgi:hypothetical protein
MTAVLEPTRTTSLPKSSVWFPLVILPTTVVLLGRAWPPWCLMWLLAGAIYAGLKWLTFADSPMAARASLGRTWVYLLLWPGMNATAFLELKRDVDRPSLGEWALALAKTGLGVWLAFGAAPLAAERSPLLAGWLGLIGIVFVLHFGLFHLLSLGWRRAGIEAPPIMHSPACATSLTDFWSRRWNRAFRDVAHAYVFHPLRRRLGPVGATLSVFVVSGLVHDVVISLPAGAGWGLPTLYFVIHGMALLFERSPVGRRIGLGRGLRGRVFCAVVTIAPLFLLFHRPFVERVALPLLTVIGAL